MTLLNRVILVSPELAQRVQDVLPSDRTVTIIPVKDTPDHPLLGQNKTSTVFERAQQRHHPPTDHEKAVAQRWGQAPNRVAAAT